MEYNSVKTKNKLLITIFVDLHQKFDKSFKFYLAQLLRPCFEVMETCSIKCKSILELDIKQKRCVCKP